LATVGNNDFDRLVAGGDVDTALDLFAASWLPILFATLTGLVATLLAVVAVSLVAEYLAARAGQRRRQVMSMRGAGAHGYGIHG
jgi:MFS family permease